jgi:hypothetical protein
MTRVIAVLITATLLLCDQHAAFGRCAVRFASSAEPIASCDAGSAVYLRLTGDEYLAHLAHAYSCYRAHRYRSASNLIDASRPVGLRELIRAKLARAAILYHLRGIAFAIPVLQSAQRLEAQYSKTSLAKVREPTGAEPLAVKGDKKTFSRFLPSALAFEFVQKDDDMLKRGASAAGRGDMCSAARLFRDSIQVERSSTARWLNGALASMMGDRNIALASWFDEVLEPQNTGEQTFNEVQWSAVSLIITTHQYLKRGVPKSRPYDTRSTHCSNNIPGDRMHRVCTPSTRARRAVNDSASSNVIGDGR